MRGFSKAIITGNLTRDPELRTTPNGASVCSFSVAVNRTYRDAGGEQREEVSYFDCSAWNKLGEMIAQYAKKGSGVLVCGRLSQRSWEDKNDGKKRSRVEIVVEDFNFAGGGDRSGDSSYASKSPSPMATDAPSSAPASEGGEIDLSDIPF